MWIINQELEFCQTWNLEWEDKYHYNSPLKLFLGKSNAEIFFKKNIKDPFLLSLPRY